MALYSYYSSGGPWTTADAYVTLNNQTITQTLYLASGDSTRCKVWFAGNGVDSYQVQSAYLTQGIHSVSVKVNGQTSFLIPAFGRWSDYSSTTAFTLPGYVSFVTIVKLNVPILIPIIGYGDTTQTAPSAPGVVSWIDDDPDSLDDGTAVLVLNFDGADGATTWTEEAKGYSPDESYGFHLDTAQKKFGTASLKNIDSNDAYLTYLNKPNITDAFTLHFYVRISGLPSTMGPQATIGFWGSSFSLTSLVDINFYRDGVFFSVSDNNGVAALDNGGDYSELLVADVWNHCALVSINRDVFLYINGALSGSWTCYKDNPFAGPTGTYLYSNYTEDVWFDAIELTDNAKWTSNFTPPTTAPPTIKGTIDIVEVTTTATITVTDNTLIAAGDTITITETSSLGQVVVTVYTFVTNPTGADNEIVIGPDADTTAANIADTINETDGAEFTASSSGAVATAVKYSSDDVAITTDSSGVTIGSPLKEITYISSSASSALPSFTVYSSGSSFGDMGDYYGNVTLPAFTSEGLTDMEGNNADVYMPAFRSTGQSFLKNYPSLMTDAEKIAMLLYESEWMEWLASLIVVPGDSDDVALVATQWVASNITYATDLTTWGVTDYWIDPKATVYYGVGDYEDGAALIASIIINSGVDPNRVRVYFGEDEGVDSAWAMYQRMSDNQWVVLDWTDGSAYWNAISDVDELTPLYPSVRQIVDFDLNPDDVAYGEADEYVDYRQVIDIAGTYFYSETLYAEDYNPVLEASIPMITLSATGGGYATLTLPSITISFTGQGVIVGNLSKSIGKIEVSAIGYQEGLGSLDSDIPAVTISATGTIHPTGTLEREIPAISLVATMSSDILGSLTKSVGAIILDGNCYWMGSNDGVLTIPAVSLVSSARAATIIALCLNTKNFGLTKYTSYDYNSLCIFNGKLIGTKRTGVYELEGTDDDGESISWKIRTPKLDMKTHKMRYAWLSGKASGDIKLVVETPDGTRYEYDAEPVAEDEDEMKIKVGKGIGGRYLILELMNEGDQTITLDKWQVYGMPGDRR